MCEVEKVISGKNTYSFYDTIWVRTWKIQTIHTNNLSSASNLCQFICLMCTCSIFIILQVRSYNWIYHPLNDRFQKPVLPRLDRVLEYGLHNKHPLISWWRHQMETFSALLAICAGNSPVHGEFPAQRPVTRSFDVPLICARIYGWVNSHEAGDLRRHHSHYDVIVMICEYVSSSIWYYHRLQYTVCY